MKKIVIAFLLCALPAFAHAAGTAVPLDRAPIDLRDTESLQRGARMFVNYCMGCHGLSHMRYSHVGRDLGLTDDQLLDNLIFTTDEDGAKRRVGELMKSAIPTGDAAAWFGVAPPDLTVVSRSRGADWIYTFLRSYYVDEGRPLGVNNSAFPNTAMPHILWELEGLKRVVDEGGPKKVPTYEQITVGSLDQAGYDAVVGDIVNFLVYMGEPMQLKRQRIGVWVLLFLAVFTVLAYLLKKEYWRDVH